MHVDFKESVWYQVFIPDHMKEAVKEKLESGEISTSNELYMYLSDNDREPTASFNLDTCEQLSIDSNLNRMTIDFMDDDGNSIWNNEKPYPCKGTDIPRGAHYG